MKLKARLPLGIVAIGLMAGYSLAPAAPHTLKGGSDYESRLEQAGMSGMSGMSGNSAAAPVAKKSVKQDAKKTGKPQTGKKQAQ